MQDTTDVTWCGLLRLCAAVAIGAIITNCWKLFRYGVKRDHYYNFIGTRELSELISVYCFDNTFRTDTGEPSIKMPSLGDIYNEVIVYTFQRLNYSSSSPHNSDISTISDITFATAPTTDIGHTASK